MSSIEEVARRAGVSTATVSRALSGRGHVSPASVAKVRQAADELGYVVSSSASSLASGRTRNIGVIVPFMGRWFFSSVLEGAQQRLLQSGYDLTLYNLSGGEDARARVFDDFLMRKRVDAVIAVSLELTPEEISRLHTIKRPLVGVGGPIPGVRTLAIDDVAIARLATEHLVSLGHHQIAHIGGSREFDLDFHLPSNRRHGYEDALRDAGIESDPALVVPADFTIQGGYRAAKQLLGAPHDRPTAIFAASDEMAFGCILAAKDLGLSAPRDVSIIGVDDHDQAEFFGLTTVAQFPRIQGEKAVDLLLDALDSASDVAESTPLPYELRVRDSTAAPSRR